MAYVNIPDSKLVGGIAKLVGSAQGKVMGKVSDTLYKAVRKFAQDTAPTNLDVKRLNQTRANLTKTISNVNSRLTKLNSIPGRIRAPLAALKTMLNLILALPIPQAVPPGIGLPISITTKYANLMHKVKEYIKQLSEDADGVEEVLKDPLEDLQNLIKRLSLFDIIAVATQLEIALNLIKQNEVDAYNALVAEEIDREQRDGIIIKSRLGITEVPVTIEDIEIKEGVVIAGRVVRADLVNTTISNGEILNGTLSGGLTLTNNIIKVDIKEVVISNNNITGGLVLSNTLNASKATLSGGILVIIPSSAVETGAPASEEVLKIMSLFGDTGDSVFKNIRIDLAEEVSKEGSIYTNKLYNATVQLKSGLDTLLRLNLDKVPNLTDNIAEIYDTLQLYSKAKYEVSPNYQYTARNGQQYTLEILANKQTNSTLTQHYATARDIQNVVVLTGPASYSSDTSILLDELKFRLDNQLA